MFDFFGEVIEFLNQVVSIINWFFSFIFQTIQTAGQSVQNVFHITEGFPPFFLAILTLSMAAMIFEFVRGRG